MELVGYEDVETRNPSKFRLWVVQAFTQNKLTSIGLDAIKNGPDIQLVSYGGNNE